jgi:serine/threonine protein phosphatase 1
MRTLCIADIHGGYKALIQCLERSKFDYENDRLISLGDIVDGWSETYECVEELLKIKNLVIINSNHDDWFKEWLLTGKHPTLWHQGGYGTCQSYCRNLSTDEKIFEVYPYNMQGYYTNLTPDDIPQSHKDFFINRPAYYIQDNKLFVHGGLNRHFSIEDKVYNREYFLIWDRTFWQSALGYEAMSRGKMYQEGKYPFKIYDGFEEVFIGHTTTLFLDTDYPVKAANVYNLDTGGGFKGRLSIMDIDTKQVWQSDRVEKLYENERGRN